MYTHKTNFKIFIGLNKNTLEKNIAEFKRLIKDKNPIETIISNNPAWKIRLDYNA
jgi:hypothetical protein